MDRLIKFNSFSGHGWLKKAHSRLGQADLALAHSFIQENQSLDKGAFELKVNRMFLDRPKPKNWTVIVELLTCCNS